MADRFYNLYYNIVANQAINTNQQMAQSFQSVQTIANQTAITINNTYTDLSNSIGTANSRLGQTPGHVGAISDSFLQMRAAMIVFHEIETVISAIGTGLQDAREYANQTAEANLKLRDTLRELAAIEGKPGPGREVTDEVIDLRVKSGMREQEAVKFASTFQSDIQAAASNLLPDAGETREQAQEKIKVRTAQMAVRLNISPAAATAMAVSTLQAHPMTGQRFEAEMAASIQNLQESKGEMAMLSAQSSAALQPLVASGAVSGMPEATILMGGMTQGTKGGRAETRLASVNNAIEKIRLKGGLQEFTEPDSHNLLDILVKMQPAMLEAAKPGHEGQQAFLLEQGFGTERARTEMMALSRPQTLQAMVDQRKRTRQDLDKDHIAATAQRNVQADATFKLGDYTGRFADAELGRADYMRGQKNEEMVKLQKRSEATLKERNLLDTTRTNIGDAMWNTFFAPFVASGLVGESRGLRKSTESARLLIEGAEAAGISRDQLGKSLPSLFMSGSPGVPNAAITPEQLAHASNKLLGPSNQSADQILKEIAKILDKMHQTQLAAQRVADMTPVLPQGVPPQIAPPPNAGGPVRN